MVNVLLIKGMKTLTDKETLRMNEIANLGNDLAVLLDRIEIIDDDDPEWIAIGRTHLQIGIMCIKRAIGKPENF